MKIKTIITSSILASAMISGAAFAAPSAKFAANWAEDRVELAFAAAPTAGTDFDGATELMATIKGSKHKELLIGVSGEARLLTFTEAKGKDKNTTSGDSVTSTSTAETTLSLEVRYIPVDIDAADAALGEAALGACNNFDAQIAVPGEITLASRIQELSVNVDLSNVELLNELEVAVEVALKLETVAAHHFNFLAIDLDESTQYNVYACFGGTALAAVVGEGSATAAVAIQKRMVTVQEVRATREAFVVEEVE